MELQNLAIIFIIIVLPMTLILTAYIQNQTNTLDLQIEYDRRLRKSTYDALKAFQLNTINSDTSDLANSKLRDIEASVNTFFTSIATNFNMVGYDKDVLKEFVPAIVYTMYDGYYIYSPYTNKLDTTKSNEVTNPTTGEIELKSDAEILNPNNENASYHEGEKVSGLKPYIHYSCRYKRGASDNFVITYSLDNYITIQGYMSVDGAIQWVNDAGYLLDNISKNGDEYKYRGITIEQEENYEYIFDPDIKRIERYQYIKLNGVKYYYDSSKGKWFSILHGEKLGQEGFNLDRIKNVARQYYKDAYEFTERCKNKYGLSTLTASMAVDEKGEKLYELDEKGQPLKDDNNSKIYKFGTGQIFDFGSANDTNGSIEDPNSNFNMHRLAVIRYCIEKNLSIAIANYNNYTTSYANFQMPKLDEEEWDRIIDNVSIITFLQGLSIGGKLYNGYSIVTNNKNQEVVQEDSIYLLTNDNEYHRPIETNLTERGTSIVHGYLNIDFEIKTAINGSNTLYYMPQKSPDSNKPIIGSYSSIVNMSDVASVENYYDYIAKTAEGAKPDILAQKYFTALGRERYGQYKTNNDYSEIKRKFQ